MPHKRYTQEQVCQKAQAYLEDDVSYARTAEEQGRPVFYDDRQNQAWKEEGAPALAPSTVWRWLSWLGGLSQTVQAASELIRQQEPAAALHREPWAIPPAKCRSQQRQHVLQQALRCLTVRRLFARLFGKEIFPDFATAQGWS